MQITCKLQLPQMPRFEYLRVLAMEIGYCKINLNLSIKVFAGPIFRIQTVDVV